MLLIHCFFVLAVMSTVASGTPRKEIQCTQGKMSGVEEETNLSSSLEWIFLNNSCTCMNNITVNVTKYSRSENCTNNNNCFIRGAFEENRKASFFGKVQSFFHQFNGSKFKVYVELKEGCSCSLDLTFEYYFDGAPCITEKEKKEGEGVGEGEKEGDGKEGKGEEVDRSTDDPITSKSKQAIVTEKSKIRNSINTPDDTKTQAATSESLTTSHFTSPTNKSPTEYINDESTKIQQDHWKIILPIALGAIVIVIVLVVLLRYRRKKSVNSGRRASNTSADQEVAEVVVNDIYNMQ